jgi:hypothetical protein
VVRYVKQLFSNEAKVNRTRLIYAMDPTKYRMRYLLAILVAAIVTAALLRHFLHLDGGYTRTEILIGALTAAAGVFLTIFLFRLARRS